MRYRWQFQPYRRRFKQALQTSHGCWAVREGIIVRLVNEAGTNGWGEIAPISWFGSETFEQALAFCHQLPSTLSSDLILSIPDALPCCQFAFESAWESLREQAIEKTEPQNRRTAESQTAFVTENVTLRPQNSDVAVQSSIVTAQNSDVAVQNSKLSPQSSEFPPQSLEFPPQNSIIAAQNPIITIQNSKPQFQSSTSNRRPLSPLPSLPRSALLPAGEAALTTWKPLWKKGFRTFKWKIGVQAIATELERLHMLARHLPAATKLRLDANGGLSFDDAAQWLETCDEITADPSLPITLEYLEQPLDVSQFEAMQDFSHRYQTPIALDESVATLQQLQACYENGWRGIFVLKPAIVGSPSRLRQFCWKHSIDAVFSSAFETAIGRQAGLRLATALGNPDRAMGYGTSHWFDDAETDDFEQLWQTIHSDE